MSLRVFLLLLLLFANRWKYSSSLVRPLSWYLPFVLRVLVRAVHDHICTVWCVFVDLMIEVSRVIANGDRGNRRAGCRVSGGVRRNYEYFFR